MIWLSNEKLENKISNGELTDKEGVSYLLAHFIFFAISANLSNIESMYNVNIYLSLIECIIVIAITVWGIKTAYNINNDIDGKDFIKRFLSISWVRIIQYSIMFLLIMLVFEIRDWLWPSSFTYDLELEKIKLLIFGIILEFLIYLAVIRSFKRLKTL